MGLHFATSEETCEYVRSQTDRVVLALSLGKDSIVAWLQLRKFWSKDQIVPIYNSNIATPDGLHNISFIDRSIAYYEEVFATKIYTIPNPEFIRQLRYGIYCSPEHLPARDYLIFNYKSLPEYSNNDLNTWLVENIEELEHAWFATGIRATDNMTRRRTIQGQGSAHPTSRKFYPVWDWTIDRIETELRANNVKLPVDYRWWKRSLDGIGSDYTEQFREKLPADYAAFKFWFPAHGVDEFRVKCVEQLLAEKDDPDYIFTGK